MKESVSRSLTVFMDVNCERSIFYRLLLQWLYALLLAVATRVEKVHKKKESVVKFSRVPKIVLTEGEVLEELTTRRQAWISAISRDDLTDDNLENERVCSRHFFCLAKLPNSGTNARIHVERVIGLLRQVHGSTVWCSRADLHYLLIICCVQIRSETAAALW